MVAARIHDRQLAALQLVAAVRVDLVDHFDQRIAAGDQDALLAIAREHHVVAGKGMRGGDRWSPPRQCISCRSWSCPAAGRDTSARRTRASAPCRAGSGAWRRATGADPTVRAPDCRRQARAPGRVHSGFVSLAAQASSGRGCAPASGTTICEKSTVSPGRNLGSGTCSCKPRSVVAAASILLCHALSPDARLAMKRCSTIAT